MKILAVTAMKNEGAFLLEWIAHCRVIGFTDFLVYSNDCTDGTDQMLDRLAALGILHHVPNPAPWEEGPQWAALKAADKHPAMKTADWAMFLDVDEFPVIHTGAGRLPDLIAALPDADAIPLTWRIFGNSGVVEFIDRPVTAQFTRAAPTRIRWPWRVQMFKTLFRTGGAYRKLGVHRPRGMRAGATPRWFDGSGRELPEIYQKNRLFSLLGEDNYQLAQLNHYALGAMETYVVKCDRGRANRAADAFDMAYWVERNFATEEDLTIARHAPELAAGIADLMADAELAALHARAVAWRRARFEALMMDENYRALFGRLLITPASQPMPKAAENRMVGYGLAARASQGSGD